MRELNLNVFSHLEKWVSSWNCGWIPCFSTRVGFREYLCQMSCLYTNLNDCFSCLLHYMAMAFRIAKWPWPFKVKITSNHHNNIRNEFHTPQLVKMEVLHVFKLKKTKKLDFHHSWWRPYLMWPLRHSWHYGGRAPRWFFMSRDPLTQFKWEILSTPSCEQVYMLGTGL